MQISTVFALAALCGVDAADPFLNKAKPYSQEFEDNYNLLKYTAWAGPFSQRRSVGLNRDPPAGCRVDQVAMLHRHGERYPSASSAREQDTAYAKIAGKKGQLKGSLEFVNWWIPYATHETAMDAQESLYGPYAGLLGAYANGAEYRRRYGHLYDPDTILPIFSAGFERISSTARKFGQGFLGYNYTDMAAVQLIPETDDQGANTLVTGDCPNGITNVTNCPVPDISYQESYTSGWYLKEFKQAANRLNKENGLNLTEEDTLALLQSAAFEIAVRGSSPWVEVFTDEEWIAFEYYQSAYYYCYFGPGAQATPYRGSVYLNATRTLFNQGPEEVLPLYFSFAHDTDITPIVSLLGFASDDEFDPRKVSFGKKWDLADIVPENARLVIERLICENVDDDEEQALESELANAFPVAFNATYTNATNATYAGNYTYPVYGNVSVPELYGNASSNSTWTNRTEYLEAVGYNASGNQTVGYNQTRIYSEQAFTEQESVRHTGNENIYIRVILNEAVVPIPDCLDGPGKSCKLSAFNELVDELIDGNDYAENCLSEDDDFPRHLSFFWDWNVTTENNYDRDPLAYQEQRTDSHNSAIPGGY